MKISHWPAWVGMTLAIQLTGCAATLPMRSAQSSNTDAPTAYQVQDLAPNSVSAPSTGMRHGQKGAFFKFMQLQPPLSAQQKEQLKVIAQQSHPMANFQAQAAELKSLLLADQVDVNALKAFVAARRQARLAQLTRRVDRLAAFRAVLTDEQRTNLVARLSQAPAHPFRYGRLGRILNHLFGNLDLTTEQQQALEALQEKLQASMANRHPEAMRQAFASFVQTGDKTALINRLQGHTSVWPSDDLVQFVAMLDLNQRKALVQEVEAFAKRMRQWKHR